MAWNSRRPAGVQRKWGYTRRRFCGKMQVESPDDGGDCVGGGQANVGINENVV